MTAIPPTSSGTPAANTQAKNSSAGMLGKDDFLKLFVAQLKNQDPTSSQDPTQSMQQMAQFSEIEQITNLVSAQNQSSAVGLIGKTVTYGDADGNPQTGVVTQVDIGEDGAATLTVGGKGGIDAGSVTQVK
jgi:flagellar basal-body rod modification protein FlgD